jgi:hypothetical protein
MTDNTVTTAGNVDCTTGPLQRYLRGLPVIYRSVCNVRFE